MGNIGFWQLLIIALIVVLLFGTKKLRSMGSDLGSAVKGFKKAVSDEESKENAAITEKKDDKSSDTAATKKDNESA